MEGYVMMNDSTATEASFSNGSTSSSNKTDKNNPFVHELRLSFLDKLQIALMSVTIAPIRLLLVILLLLLAWPVAALALAFRSDEDRLKPITGWRLLLKPIVVFLCRGVFFAGGFFWVHKKGKQVTSREAPILLVAPHSSYFDALPVVVLGLNSVVAKASTKKIALFGTLTEFSEPVLVNREDPNSRINTIKEIQRRGQSGGKWPQITIFPEGTCTNRSCLISFKQGAFYPGVPVQPVCVRYPNRLDTITWTWEGPGAFLLLWLTLCQFYTRFEVEFLPVYTPNEAEKADPQLFGKNVRAVMAKCLQCPVADHTYADSRPATSLQKPRLSLLKKIQLFESLHASLGVGLDEMKTLLEKLKKLAGQPEVVQVVYQQFSSLLDLSPSAALRQLFDLLDGEVSGVVDVREYITGLSYVVSASSIDDTIHLAFQLYDSQCKGYLTKDELFTLLGKTFSISGKNKEIIFEEIDTSSTGQVTADQFSNYAHSSNQHRRYFTSYQDLKLKEQRKSLEKKFSNGHAAELQQRNKQEDVSSKKLQ